MKPLWLRVGTVLVLASLLVGACGPSVPTAEPEQPAPAASDDEPAVAEPTEVQEPILVAFAFNGPITDGGWTTSHNAARLAVEEHFGGAIRTEYVENMPFTPEASRILEQFIADGARMIIACSYWGDNLDVVAARHPDVIFLTMTAAPEGNGTTYYIQHWMTSYLLGVAAGLMTETDQLGYVGSFNYPTIKLSASSFHMGARSVNPDVTTRVVLTSSWFDPPAERQAAEALVISGADVLFTILNSAAVLEVADERGVHAAMWNTDMRAFGPSAYINSVILDWTGFYISEIQAVLDGTWEADRHVFLPLGGGTDIGEWGENVPQDVRDAVEAVRARMINEGFNPFAGPMYDRLGNLVIEDGVVPSALEIGTGWTWEPEGVLGLEN